MGAALRHRIAGDDDRTLGLGQQLGGGVRPHRASPRMRGATRVGSSRSMSASFFRMSPGSDRNTGPVGGASAVFAARCTQRRQVLEPVAPAPTI